MTEGCLHDVVPHISATRLLKTLQPHYSVTCPLTCHVSLLCELLTSFSSWAFLSPTYVRFLISLPQFSAQMPALQKYFPRFTSIIF